MLLPEATAAAVQEVLEKEPEEPEMQTTEVAAEALAKTEVQDVLELLEEPEVQE